MLLWVLAISLPLALAGKATTKPIDSTDNFHYEVGKCRPSYERNSFGTKCYKYYSDPETWAKAVKTCKEDNATLAIPRDQFEATDLSNLLKKHVYKLSYYHPEHQRFFFLGIVRWDENEWREIGTNSIYNFAVPWAKGEPNNHEGKESCLTLDFGGNLNDYYCNKKTVFFCEYQLPMETLFVDLVLKNLI